MASRTNCVLVVLLGIVLSVPGCSYPFVHGPPASLDGVRASGQEAPQGRVTCTTSNTLPILDTVLGVSLLGVGAAGVGIAVASSHCSGSCDAPYGAGDLIIPSAVAAAVGAVALASAVTGYGRTADCRRVTEPPSPGADRNARYLLDLNGIAESRAKEERERF